MRRTKKIHDIKIQLYCPFCGTQHIDEGWYAVNPHKQHLCFSCGKKFLAIKPTIGIGKFKE
jgi:transposase-like protein